LDKLSLTALKEIFQEDHPLTWNYSCFCKTLPTKM